MTSDATTSPDTAMVRRPPVDLLEDFLAVRVASLQRQYRADHAGATATLARLRRSLPGDGRLGADMWEIFDAFPAELAGHDDDPSAAEYAAAATLGLFAIHQQSVREQSMHQRGPAHSLGRGIARLAVPARSEAVQRRFRALTRASSTDAALQHLRGLVPQLRGERIALDYGRLGRDLYHLQFPARVLDVRMRWTRDFRMSTGAGTDGDQSTTAPTGDNQ